MGWAIATGCAAIPLYVGYRWWQRYQRELALARELDDDDEPPTIPEHLSPLLAALAMDTRRLRRELEATLLRLVHAPLLSETPWARRERCDEYDAALYEIRRATWEWLTMMRKLGPEVLQQLGEHGLSVVPFRRVLFGCDRTSDVWEQVLYMKAPDLEQVWVEFRRTIVELERFEQALLLQGGAGPYR